MQPIAAWATRAERIGFCSTESIADRDLWLSARCRRCLETGELICSRWHFPVGFSGDLGSFSHLWEGSWNEGQVTSSLFVVETREVWNWQRNLWGFQEYCWESHLIYNRRQKWVLSNDLLFYKLHLLFFNGFLFSANPSITLSVQKHYWGDNGIIMFSHHVEVWHVRHQVMCIYKSYIHVQACLFL